MVRRRGRRKENEEWIMGVVGFEREQVSAASVDASDPGQEEGRASSRGRKSEPSIRQRCRGKRRVGRTVPGKRKKKVGRGQDKIKGGSEHRKMTDEKGVTAEEVSRLLVRT